MTIPALGQFVSYARTAAPRARSTAPRARTTAPRRDRTVPPWAIASAGLTPILLTAGWLVAGTLQPASYNPIRDTVSVMAGHGGTDRWVMTGALLLVGGFHLVTAAGLGALRVSARVLLILAGLSSLGIAASPEPAGRLHSAAPRLDLVRGGHHHGMAGFHGQVRISLSP